MISPKAADFLTQSNRTIADEAARVTEHTERAEALRALKQRVRAAAADGTLDASELEAIEAEADRLGVGAEIAPTLARIRAAAVDGSVATEVVAGEVADLNQSIGAAISTSLSAARPSVELQLAVQNEQIAMQMFSATLQAYHRTSMNIIGNLKA